MSSNKRLTPTFRLYFKMFVLYTFLGVFCNFLSFFSIASWNEDAKRFFIIINGLHCPGLVHMMGRRQKGPLFVQVCEISQSCLATVRTASTRALNLVRSINNCKNHTTAFVKLNSPGIRKKSYSIL